MEQYRIKDLSFSYPNSPRLALDRVDLCINQGEFIVLCGPSGSGKSTLLRHLKTVLTPAGDRTGKIYFEGLSLIHI